MKRLFALTSILLLFNLTDLEAFQKTKEIARINNTSILADEFLYAFKKNRDPDVAVNRDSLLSYLNRFINFKLKVQEARKYGTDTLIAFRQEYESYASQVSKPYLDNPNKEELFITEHPKSQLEIIATDFRPVAEIIFSKRSLENETLDFEDFIAVKGITAIALTNSAGEQYYELRGALPNELISSYGKPIPYKPNMQVRAEIISVDKSLFQRIFSQFFNLVKNEWNEPTRKN